MLSVIFTILGTLVPVVLQSAGVTNASTTTLLNSLIGPVGTLLTNLTTGQSKTEDALAALGAMQGVVTVLQAQTTLPEAVLTQLKNVAADIQAALAAYVKAEGGLDLTQYQQIAPIA